MYAVLAIIEITSTNQHNLVRVSAIKQILQDFFLHLY